jgi:hypothetical protein
MLILAYFCSKNFKYFCVGVLSRYKCLIKRYITIHSVNFGLFLLTENLKYFWVCVLNRYNNGNRYNVSLRQRSLPCIITKNIRFWIILIHWIWSYIFIEVSELILIISSLFSWSFLGSYNQILNKNLLNSIRFCKIIK